MRARCPQCARPLSHCLCALIPQLPSRTRVLILQHPQEVGHALNTARLAALGLLNCELRCAEYVEELPQLLSDSRWHSCLLFPGEQSVAVGRFATESAAKPLQLVVWHLAQSAQVVASQSSLGSAAAGDAGQRISLPLPGAQGCHAGCAVDDRGHCAGTGRSGGAWAFSAVTAALRGVDRGADSGHGGSDLSA